jgi:hypothetical protein
MKRSTITTSIIVAVCLTGCTTIKVDAPHPAELSLGRGSRVCIVPEQGSDANELALALFQKFSTAGFYELVDRANMGNTMQERNFQQMSFVDSRSSGRMKSADAFIYLSADGFSRNQNDSQTFSYNGQSITTYTAKTFANYRAGYRAVQTSSSQIAGGRRIELSDQKTATSTRGFPSPPDPYEMFASMREKIADQIFDSLHPRVDRISRAVGGTKAPSTKRAIGLANAGMWKDAVQSARDGVNEMPADLEAKYILAMIYQGGGMYSQCDQELKGLMKIKPSSKYTDALRENQIVWNNAARFKQQMQ